MSVIEKRRRQYVEYIANPENPPLNRTEMALQVLGYKEVQGLYRIFTPDQMSEMEKEALELRRTKYSNSLVKVDVALLKAAESGDVAAVKLAYQRFEGWSEKKKLSINTRNESVVLKVNLIESKPWVNDADS